MGTFGTGPFGSDGVLDLLEELGELAESERLTELHRLLSAVGPDGALLSRDIFPDEIVAAVALVAISLPDGETILHSQPEVVADELATALLASPAEGLAGLALSVLDLIAGPDGLWMRGWADETRRAEAEQTVAELKSVLQRSVPEE